MIVNCRNVVEPMNLTVVGNKNDLEAQRAVSREEAFLFTSSIGGSYFETSAINGGKGIEEVFISTARGLLQLSDDSACSSIKRYNSVDSILNCNDLNGFYDKTNLSSVHLGIPVDPNVEANDTGRLEMPPWSINHIAHGDEHRTGWCCYWKSLHLLHCVQTQHFPVMAFCVNTYFVSVNKRPKMIASMNAFSLSVDI